MTTYQQLVEAISKTKKLDNERIYTMMRIKMMLTNIHKLDDVYRLLFDQILKDYESFDYLTTEIFDAVDDTNADEFNDGFNEDIKKEFLRELRDILTSGEAVYAYIDNIVNDSTSAKNYEHLKAGRKKAKQLLVDMPKDIIENTFNCNVKYFDEHEKFDLEKMREVHTAGYMEIDNIKEIRNPETDLGTFVYACDKPAIMDNDTNEVMAKGEVETYIVKLSERLSRFNLVK